jgi:ZIP family zinc transporter
MEGSILFAFGLTLLAGLCTGIGSVFVLLFRKPSLRVLSFGLGFSAGVMVFLSLVELLPEAGNQIAEELGETTGAWLAAGCFFGGILLSAIIDKLVPDPENPHEAVSREDLERAVDGTVDAPAESASKRRLARVGLLTTVVIGIHNFPEGMATFVSAMADVSLGLSVAIAVAIHNIPEGISVAVPVFFATGSRKKAVWQSFATGLAEPLGALVVWLALTPFLGDAVVGAMLAGVAGIMVFISFDELLPTAREYGHGHTEIVGIVLGMALMSVSLLLLGAGAHGH